MDTRTASDTRSGDRLGWVLGLTSTAYFMVVLDSLVVVSALPHMQYDLHASVASLQWARQLLRHLVRGRHRNGRGAR